MFKQWIGLSGCRGAHKDEEGQWKWKVGFYCKLRAVPSAIANDRVNTSDQTVLMFS